MRGVKQRSGPLGIAVCGVCLAVVASPDVAGAQAAVEPEARVWVDRLVKQVTALKTIWGRFLLEEDRHHKNPPTPPDPNKPFNTLRQPGFSISEVFWVYDGFRERFDRKQIEPKEPVPGEFSYDNRKFFNGELFIDQWGNSVNLRKSGEVLDWTPRRFFLTVVNRPYPQAIREAKAIRLLDPEVKNGVEVAGFEMDLEQPGPFRIRVYLETQQPYFLRGHEEYLDGKLKTTRWIDAYEAQAQAAGWLCPQEAYLETHGNNVRYTLRTQEVHVNDSVPEEHWQMRFAPGDYISDHMTGNFWKDVDKLSTAELERRLKQPVNLTVLRGEPDETGQQGAASSTTSTQKTQTPRPAEGYSWTDTMVIPHSTN